MGHSKKSARVVERDDSASEPYSDELNVSSPELLDFGAEGEVLFNSDWQEGNGAEKKEEEVDDAVSGESENQSGPEHAEDDWGTTDGEDLNTGDDDSEDENENIKRQLRTVSFGSLAKAQDALRQEHKKRKRTDNNDNTEETLAALRKRLKELQESDEKIIPKKSHPGKPGSHSHNFARVNNEHELASDSSASGADTHSANFRSSKHAPTVRSSKYAVSRKRTVVSVPKTSVRDPRFDPMTGTLDREKLHKNYKFLDDYVDSEIKELKAKLKGQKLPDREGSRKKKKRENKLTPEEVIALKKELTQKESKRATQEARERELEVQSEHRKHEKEMVKRGKQPYFLKKSEMKKQVLVKRFESMGEGKIKKAMERKRKKMASKERKNMPTSRRF
jgi:ribosomal RNA-processing protein 36